MKFALFLIAIFVALAYSTSPPAPEEPCICTMDYNPVCGSDGVTYGNGCSLNCETHKHPELSVAYDGPCTKKI